MSLGMRLVDSHFAEKDKLKQLYIDAFPMEERIPMWLLLRKAKKEYVHFFALYDEHTLLGFTYYVLYKDITFVQYLVIDKMFSSKGYGSQVLTMLEERYPNHRMVLNIEAMDETAYNHEQRVRRKSFYTRNGFENSKFSIIQFKFHYEVLVNGNDITKEELCSLFKLFSGIVSYKLSRLEIIEYKT